MHYRAEQGYTIEQIYGVQPYRAIIMVDYCVCFFVLEGFSSHSRIFHSYGDVIIANEGLQILTYARHSCIWPLRSEGSLACHTCDTGIRLYIIVISENP